MLRVQALSSLWRSLQLAGIPPITTPTRRLVRRWRVSDRSVQAACSVPEASLMDVPAGSAGSRLRRHPPAGGPSPRRAETVARREARGPRSSLVVSFNHWRIMAAVSDHERRLGSPHRIGHFPREKSGRSQRAQAFQPGMLATMCHE